MSNNSTIRNMVNQQARAIQLVTFYHSFNIARKSFPKFKIITERL